MLPRASSFFTSAPLPPSNTQLCVTRGAEEIVVRGRATIKLRGHQAMRRVVDALVRLRRAKPGEAMSVDEVYAIGWPSRPDREGAEAEARSRRVYTMMSRLRRMGMQDVVVTDEVGYLIDPRWQVQQISSIHDVPAAIGF